MWYKEIKKPVVQWRIIRNWNRAISLEKMLLRHHSMSKQSFAYLERKNFPEISSSMSLKVSVQPQVLTFKVFFTTKNQFNM
jgi:hypothetical protein